MDNILELANVFTRDNYPPDPQTNRSEVPLEDIYAELANRFPQGYRVEVTDSGSIQTNTGVEGYIVVRVALPMSNGTAFTFAGAAQGAYGMPGLLTSAVRNAFLRHAGMGTELYQHEEGSEPIYNSGGATAGIPGSPFGQGDQHGYNQPTPNAYGNGGYNQPPPAPNGYAQPAPYNAGGQGGYNTGGQNGYNNGGNRGPGNYGPWTGEVVIKSGQFAGLKWAQLPPDAISNMAGKGNVLANKELARRNGQVG